MTRTERTCECGRSFAKYQGLEVHWRSCSVERERSNVYVAALEAGTDPWAATAAWRAARA